MVILHLNRFKVITSLDRFYFFIPIFAVFFIFTAFWMFLYRGYEQIYEKDKFFVILMNLFIFNLVCVLIYLKLSNMLSILNWFNILGILSMLHGFNFLYFALQNIDKKNNTFNSTQYTDQNTCESYLLLIDIIINVSFILFFSLLGFYLDNNLNKNRENALFVLIWITSILLIIKFYNRNEKIKNFNEWKKMVIKK